MKRFDDQPALQQFLEKASAILGAARVFASAEDRETYSDQMSFDAGRHAPRAAVAPKSVAEIQALIKLAVSTGVPIWPISRGKNFGYGGSAPQMANTVIIDMSRMKRILEVNEELGYCVVEPGVSFFDLYAHLQAGQFPLWMSVPGNAWGSVAGNALERGVGPQPYGDHGAQICGLEVILPDGSLLRTGAGAMAGSPSWNVSRSVYGPGWDQMFCQSNFGVVTKLGLWLMPAPEATMTLNLALQRPEDLERGIEMLRPLRQRGVIDHDPAWVSYVGIASIIDARQRWYRGSGLMPEAIGKAIREELGIGWWNARLTLYGYESVIAAKAGVIQAALQPHFDQPLRFSTWRQGDPIEQSGAGVPGTRDMNMIGWRGGRGGHIGFSPVMPANGRLALAQFQRTWKRFNEFGIDYYGAFGVGGRAVTNINEILYDRDDPEMAKAVDGLFRALVADTTAAGYPEYRAHIDYMDEVAHTLNFSNHAMLRLNGIVKDAIDPEGILAPGKQGIWPARFRS